MNTLSQISPCTFSTFWLPSAFFLIHYWDYLVLFYAIHCSVGKHVLDVLYIDMHITIEGQNS